MNILAIDTSCDDTSVAVLSDDRVLANVVSSQIDIHREWGGVVPNLARREHEKMIGGCIELALKRSGTSLGPPINPSKKLNFCTGNKSRKAGETFLTNSEVELPVYGRTKGVGFISAIAVTYGPGLAPALQVGVEKAKELALSHNLPLYAVDHMEGHTLSALLRNKNGTRYSGLEKVEFPFLALCVSGGHSEIVWCEEIGKYEILGQTLDDAAGEAFDKVARMLDLGYPGGPIIADLARKGDPTKYALPRPMEHSGDLNFSFSGLKTAALYGTNKLKEELGTGFAKEIPDYCASFQEAVVDSLILKTRKAIKTKKPKMVLLGGGVSANLRLRAKLRSVCKKEGVPAYFPPKVFTADNASMIGLAGYYKAKRREIVKNINALDRNPSLRINDNHFS